MGKAVIHFLQDTLSKELEPFAIYSVEGKEYRIKAGYFFRNFEEGQRVNIIYELSQPAKGAVYNFWGYWITWGETLFSLFLMTALYKISHAVTKNPSPESLVEQMEFKPAKRRKYED